MKLLFFLGAYCMFCISFSTSCKNPFDHNINISVHDDDGSYEFSASYNKNSTWKVQRYINENTKPDGLYESKDDYINAGTSLQDGTKFHIKGSPGELEINLDKNENSTESYYRIKRMCEGIKSILAGK